MTKSGFLHKIAQYRFGNEIKKCLTVIAGTQSIILL